MTAPTWAVVPSDGRASLLDCISSLHHQVDGVIVVVNGADRDRVTRAVETLEPLGVTAVHDPGTDRNISRWWNLGIDRAARLALRTGAGTWNTLVVNDDTTAPANLTATLASALRATGAAMAYPNQHDSHETVWRAAEPVNLAHRITGFCFLLRGENRLLRADENLVWWYGDDDLDWRARQQGGAALVSGCAVGHHEPNGYTNAHPELQEQTARDRETFHIKWGRTPW